MRKQLAAMTLALAMAASLIAPAGTAEAKTTGAQDLINPFVSKTAGQTVWDCIYFGNYWQTKYKPDNAPSGMSDDVVRTDAAGNKYLAREDGSCYRYEPIKWRVCQVIRTMRQTAERSRAIRVTTRVTGCGPPERRSTIRLMSACLTMRLL